MSPNSPHQDSPKVPEWPLAELHRTEGDVYPHAPGPLGVEEPRESETYVPVSALLSDEVVEALAKRRYATRIPRWDKLPVIERKSLIEAARLDLQAAIEHVGGGQG